MGEIVLGTSLRDREVRCVGLTWAVFKVFREVCWFLLCNLECSVGGWKRSLVFCEAIRYRLVLQGSFSAASGVCLARGAIHGCVFFLRDSMLQLHAVNVA